MAQPRSRVLFVSPSAYRLGGLATWLDYLLPGLDSSGWQATLALVAGPRHHHPKSYLAEHPWSDTVEVVCRTGTERGRRNAIRGVVQRFSPDVVCSVNIPDALAAVAELRWEGLSSARSVLACHGLEPDLFADMRKLGPSLDLVVCVNRLACALAEEAVASAPVAVKYAPCGTAVPRRLGRRLDGRLLTIYHELSTACRGPVCRFG